MTRSQRHSHVAGWLLALALILSVGTPGQAQPASEAAGAPAPTAPTSKWPLLLGVLGGIALGVLGARIWAKSSRNTPIPEVAPLSGSEPAPAMNKARENVPRSPAVQSMRQVQTGQVPPTAQPKKAAASSKPKSKSKNSAGAPSSWPAVPPRPAAMNPSQPSPGAATGPDQPLKPGQTVEWAKPSPPSIQELIDATAGEPASANPVTPDVVSQPASVAPPATGGPVHYYAPAPDVPSIEHRKLSPNPLPQMPLLITLAHAEATTAQFSFSPQADQSRIIGNGVRELKEFFAFELPPTEQFTTIKSLRAGKLEKRDDAWHVVQKAEIALS